MNTSVMNHDVHSPTSIRAKSTHDRAQTAKPTRGIDWRRGIELMRSALARGRSRLLHRQARYSRTCNGRKYPCWLTSASLRCSHAPANHVHHTGHPLLACYPICYCALLAIV